MKLFNFFGRGEKIGNQEIQNAAEALEGADALKKEMDHADATKRGEDAMGIN